MERNLGCETKPSFVKIPNSKTSNLYAHELKKKTIVKLESLVDLCNVSIYIFSQLCAIL